MEVKPGRKQTEAGIIPSDWGSSSLGECLEAHPSYGINAPATPDRADLPRYLRITDISEEGKFIPNPPTSVNHNSSNKFLLKEGDITIARTGASTGKSYQYDKRDGDLVYAGFLIKISPNKNTINPTFLASYLKTKRYWNWINQTSTRSGQPGINANQLAELDVPLPPIHEQIQIATALSNMDTLLECLNSLINKKRAIKQATMQQLLSGKTRLSGHKGKWHTKQLGELSEIRSGGTPSTSDKSAWSGEIPWCTPTDITALNGKKYLSQTSRSITEHGLRTSSAELIPKNSIIMTTRATIGECAINLVPMATNQGFKNIIPSNQIDTEFLYYLLSIHKQKLACLASGSTFLEIGKEQLRQITLFIPCSKEEQTDIANTIGDMDSEIEALNRNIEKKTSIKQAMMQELLTGRTRLI